MVKCTSGTLEAARVAFERTIVESQNCALTVQQSKHDGTSDRSITATGGKITIENNLILESYDFVDSMDIRGSAPGSVIRFNTFVNTSGINSGGVALVCDNTQDVSNNIFAYRSTNPLNGCTARYSLFDAVATPAARAGEGNRPTEFALIFANASMKDFHLASASDAKGNAQPNLINVDFEGAPRPRPANTNPDMGCYEAP
jgi:hypothetical protein